MNENVKEEGRLEDRTGISSRFWPDEYERLMALASESGFGAFELSVGNFGADDPLWPRTCDAETREHLRESLRSFSRVILRAATEGLNIASINPGQRHESVRQYLECIDFARDVGAGIISFEPGTQTWGFVSDTGDILKKNLSFATKALAPAAEDGVRLAFRTTGMSLENASALMAAIDSDAFGVDLCVGALAVEGGVPRDADELTDRVLTWIDAFQQCLAIVRLNGVHQRWHTDRLAGCPFEMNTCLDFAAILDNLTQIHYRGPLILDISAPDPASMMHYCETARSELLRYCSRTEC